jgi:SagB-type dehydrogenase family enzyme
MVLAFDDPQTLALLYHLNSAVWGNAAAYAEQVHEPSYREPPEDAIVLPAAPGSEFDGLVAARRSCRAFAGSPLSLATLGAILRAGYGLTGVRQITQGWSMYGRSVPSAGGLYPLAVYLAVERIDGVAHGIYRFNPLGALEPIPSQATLATVRSHLLQPEACAGANAIVIITAEFARTLEKYGPRGYRYILLETGHVAQNICLAAVGFGLATLCLGGFSDVDLNADLALDGRSQAVLYCIAVGAPS